MGISVTGGNRRLQTLPESGLLWVGPTRAAALRAARSLRTPGGPPAGEALSLAALLRRPAEPEAPIVLCPEGRSVAADQGFLRAARRRAFWSAPPGLLRDAVAGLLTLPAPEGPPTAGPRGGPGAAILLEGTVDARRAERASASREPRLWILQDPRRLRIPERLRQRLERRGVRFCALRPLEVAAVVASPRLAAARSRWMGLFPPGTRVLVPAARGLRSAARSRRSSRR
jgi:hypothetical protein